MCPRNRVRFKALDRTQPSLPMKKGRGQTLTHDYKRHGTIDLFAALNIATGEVITHCQDSHASVDVLRFFKIIDRQTPPNLAIHVVLDNLSAHNGSEIKQWLAHPRRKRWTMHFTPTASSWLNLVERWFKELTDRRLCHGVFTSLDDLIDALQEWATQWNNDPKPFIWHKTADQIITKVKRGRATLHQIKSATDH